ncbi:MAG: hypothetical protein QNL51_17955 [Opitutaceae bacterium]
MTQRATIQYLFVIVGILGLAAQDNRVSTSAPVKDYAVSFFSDEGYPRVRVIGEAADLADTSKVRLTGMELILYSGLADRSVETSLASPLAILEPEPELVSGPDAVKLVRSDFEVTGYDWSYDLKDRRIRIRRQARVIFKTPLDGLLE